MTAPLAYFVVEKKLPITVERRPFAVIARNGPYGQDDKGGLTILSNRGNLTTLRRDIDARGDTDIVVVAISQIGQYGSPIISMKLGVPIPNALIEISKPLVFGGTTSEYSFEQLMYGNLTSRGSTTFRLSIGRKNVEVNGVEYDRETMVGHAILNAIDGKVGKFVMEGSNGEWAIIEATRLNLKMITDRDEINATLDEIERKMIK